MMDDGIADILDQCLARIEQGATVEECLAVFPARRAEIELPLRMAAQVAELPRPAMPGATRAALEAKMLAAAAARRAATATNGAHKPAPQPAAPPSRAPLAQAGILTAILRGLGLSGPSRQPWLRPLALAATIVFALALSAGALAAARALVDIVRPQPAPSATAAPTTAATAAPAPRQIDGAIEQIAQERWVVGGQVVIVGANTVVDGAPSVGSIAHISGTPAAGGALLADRISVEAPLAPTDAPAPAATAVPTETPAPAATAAPKATAAPAAQPQPTAAPEAAPTSPPEQPPAPTDGSNSAAATPENVDHQCQGQQLGRDEKTCDPNQNADPQKPDSSKPDSGKDKPKDGNGKTKTK